VYCIEGEEKREVSLVMDWKTEMKKKGRCPVSDFTASIADGGKVVLYRRFKLLASFVIDIIPLARTVWYHIGKVSK